jgi:molybdate transport system substrate-binding protein
MVVAIANPEYAPYRLAAKQALESAGVWDVVAPKLVLGEDIAQTFQFIQTGNAKRGALLSPSFSVLLEHPTR